MANNTDLRVRISADMADIKQGLGLLRGELAKVKAQAAQTAPDTTAWSRGLAGLRQQVLDVAAAYVSWRAISGIVRGVFDSFDRMDRIDEMRQMVALSSEELSKFAYAAQFSGVELESLGKGFSFFQRNLSKNGELLKTLGVDAPSLSGKLRQLLDVFSKLPDGPEKAAVAAELFGSRFGANLIPLLNEGVQKFDELSEAAARTGNVFTDEATAGAAQFNDNLDTMKSTLSGVFNVAAQQLIPAMSAYAGEANEAAQQSQLAAEGGRFLASAFKIVGVGAAIVKNTVEAVVNVLAFLADSALNTARTITTALGGAFSTVGASMKAFLSGGPLAAFNVFTEGVKKNSGALLAASKTNANQIKGGWNAMRDGVTSAVSDVGRAFDAAFATGNASANRAKDGVQGIGTAAQEATAKGEALRKTLAALFNPNPSGGAKAASAAKDKAKELIAGLADQGALALDQVDRDLDALEQRYEDGLVKLSDYFAQRQALELQRIDTKIEEAQADALAAKSSEEQSRALTEIIKLQRDRAAIGPATAREQAKAEKEAAAATLENLRAKQADIQQRLQGGTDFIAAQVQIGAVGPFEAERQLFDLRQRSIEQLRALRQAVVNYLAAQAAGSPEHAAAIAGLQDLDTQIAQVQASQQTFANGVKEQATQSLTTFFTDLANGAKSFKDAFKDMVVSFVQGLARMAAEALAQQAIQALFRTLGSGFAQGGAFTSSGQAFAKGAAFALPGLMAFANGGAFTNQIFSDPTLFKFGAGGQFGVMGEAGPEAVMPLTRGPGGRLGVDAHGGGGGRSRVTTPIVVLGDRALADALAGTAGEDVVITHVMNNIDKIRGA
jgi:lambda family phage tail tape measure protein